MIYEASVLAFFAIFSRPLSLTSAQHFARTRSSFDVLEPMISMESNVGFSAIHCAALCKVQQCDLWRRIPPSVCQIGFESLMAAPAAQPVSLTAAANGEKFYSSMERELGKAYPIQSIHQQFAVWTNMGDPIQKTRRNLAEMNKPKREKK